MTTLPLANAANAEPTVKFAPAITRLPVIVSPARITAALATTKAPLANIAALLASAKAAVIFVF